LVYLLSPRKENQKQIPGPKGIPLLGDTTLLIKEKKMHQYREDNRIKYGDIYQTQIFNNTVIILSDADAAKKILTDKNFFRSNTLQKLGSGILDNALFVMPTDDQWKLHRKLLQPSFGPSHIREAASQTVTVTNSLVSIWNEKIETNPTIDIYDQLSNATLDVIGLIAFGVDLEAVKGSKEDDAFWNELDSAVLTRVNTRITIPPFLWSAFGLGEKSQNIVEDKEKWYKYMRNLIPRCAASAESKDSSKWGLNVLQRLLECKDLTEEEVFGEMVGFFLAGHETTSNTITFGIYELCNNPEIQERLYEEIKDVKENQMEAVNSLPFLENFVKEVQRLHSIVGGVTRNNIEATEILGYHVPANTRVVLNIRGIHRNPKYYSDPEKFDPDRWLEPNAHPYAFMPFGDGPHNCIGKKMAMVEAKIMILVLLQSFKFQKYDDQVINVTTQVTTSIKGFKATLVPRY